MGHVLAIMDPHRRPPVLDMTPEGEFRDPEPSRRTGTFDRLLERLGAWGVLVAAATGGLMLAGLAIRALGCLGRGALGAGARGAGAVWGRPRRARRDGVPPQAVRFVFIRR